MKVFTEVASDTNLSTVVRLTYEQRLKHRLLLKLSPELNAQIILPRGQRLSSGLHIRADDGSVLMIEQADEEISLVTASGHELARACYHLGNRHIPAAIGPQSVAYLRDTVIDAMMKGLGFEVSHRTSGFEPEPGAYAGHGH